MIAFRKAHGALRMTTAEDIQNNLKFVDGVDANVVAYTIENSPNGEIAEEPFVVYNANKEPVSVSLPEGEWEIYINGEKAGCEKIGTAQGSVEVEGISAMVLTKGNSGNAQAVADTKEDAEGTAETSGQVTESKGNGIVSTVLICAGVVLLAVAVVLGIRNKKGKKKD